MASTPLPAWYPFDLRRGQDWIKEIEYKDDNNTAINLSGYSAISQVWNKERSKMYVQMAVTITSASEGKIEMKLTDSQTSILPDLSYYDLRVTTGTTSYYVIEGTITAYGGYSR